MLSAVSSIRPKASIEAQRLTEVKDLRNQNSKTYQKSVSSFRTEVSVGARHYFDASTSSFEDIRLTPISSSNIREWEVSRANYTAVFNFDTFSMNYNSRDRGAVSAKLVEIGGSSVNDLNLVFDPEIRENQIIFQGVLSDLDLALRFNPSKVEFNKIIHSASAPHVLRWEYIIDNDASVRINTNLKGKDNIENTSPSGRDLERRKQRSIEIDTKVAEDATTIRGKTILDVSEIITGRTLRKDPVTRVPEWRDKGEMVYPTFVDADIEEEIVTTNDDGYGYNDSTWDNNNTVFGWYDATGDPGARFQGIPLNQGVIITGASLVWQILNTSSDSASGRCYGYDVDSSGSFSDTNRPDQLAKTSASTVVNMTETAGPFTVDITGQVQEIVNRSGWASGQNMSFFMLTDNIAATAEFVDLDDYPSANEPKLLIDWESVELIEQEGYRHRKDDGDEGDASWAANQDTNITVGREVPRRTRFVINAEDGNPDSTRYQIEYKRSGESVDKFRPMPES